MRIAFGTDDDTAVTDGVMAALVANGHTVEQVGTGAPWPEVGRAVANAVVAGSAERGIVCCYTGTGVCMAANKVRGARAALCTDAATAQGARRWNDANVLAFGLRLTTLEVATEMVEAFLVGEPDESERAAIARLEEPLG